MFLTRTGMAAVDLTQLTPKEFGQFQKLIFELSGIQVPENKIMLLSNRIRRRVKATGVVDFESYLKLLHAKEGRPELEGFLDAVTTNETSFFRTEKHFEWLQTEFISELCQQAKLGQRTKSVRIWSAACSSGEEPYTIAMCLAENRARLAGWKAEIHGTDISEQSMEKARQGVFQSRSIEGIPENLLNKYFVRQPDTDSWQAKPSLTEMITVFRHNLMEPSSKGAYDCIFLRNVLIYFSRESKQVVIDHLVRSLAIGGYLVVGPSEGIFDMLGMLEKRSTFLYQKASRAVRS
jgi:chemotaxis protein methyltransferase CheR